jgi:DNA modification methylase
MVCPAMAPSSPAPQSSVGNFMTMMEAEVTTDFSDGGRPARALNKNLSERSRARRRSLKSEVALSSAAESKRRNDLAPVLTISYRDPGSLRPARRRVRTSDPEHVARLTRAISGFGFTVPVLISRDGEIVDGHIRVEAARALGLAEVPCMVVDHLNDDERRLLSIAVNRLQEKGAWDIDQLKLEFESLIELDVPLEATGFELPEIEVVLSSGDHAPDEEANDSPPVDHRLPAISRPGDCWRLGGHVVLCADACEGRSYQALMAGEVARIMLTDPPFNCPIDGFVGGKGEIRHREFVTATGEMSDERFEGFLHDFLACAMSCVIDGGIGLSFIDWRQVELLLHAGRRSGLSLQNIIIWDKGRGGMGGTYRNAHELIAMFKRGDAPHLNNIELGKHGRDRTNIWSYPGATTLGSSARQQLKFHPTPKSVELIVDAILDLTSRDDIVLDPFLGSGTTLIAAEKSGRRCHGLELDPAYVDVIVRRWQTFTGSTAIRADDGRRFTDLEQERLSVVPPDRERSAPREGLPGTSDPLCAVDGKPLSDRQASILEGAKHE